jgi:hypothetical protein
MGEVQAVLGYDGRFDQFECAPCPPRAASSDSESERSSKVCEAKPIVNEGKQRMEVLRMPVSDPLDDSLVDYALQDLKAVILLRG